MEHAGNDIAEIVKTFNAANMDNAVKGIQNAIDRVERMMLKVEMTDASKRTMEDGCKKMLQKEADLFINHKKAIGGSIKAMEAKFESVVERYKGVFMDRKTYTFTSGCSMVCLK